MTASEWQAATQERIDDATSSLAAGRWSWAYYTAGYIVEFALKACVARVVAADPGVVFRVRRLSDQCFSHDFRGLIATAGIEKQRDAALANDPRLKARWLFVASWKESSRYDARTEASARELFEAIMHPQHGVLSWVQQHW